MEWLCKYCNQIFNFEKHQQCGAHLRNCKSNPSLVEINKKAAAASRKAIVVNKFEIVKNCLTCNAEIKQFLSQKEIDNNEVKLYCNRICFNNRFISNSLIENINTDNNIEKLFNNRTLSFREKRINFQNIGKVKIKQLEPLYIAGCMLYWGEGSKNKNSVIFTNSDPFMLILFKKFLQTYFEISNSEIAFSINCYTDLRSLEEIENYWLKILGLERSSLRKGQINNLPKSSKNKSKKSEYGTVRLIINNTRIVQEIFGAIQGFGDFENKEWLG